MQLFRRFRGFFHVINIIGFTLQPRIWKAVILVINSDLSLSVASILPVASQKGTCRLEMNTFLRERVHNLNLIVYDLQIWSHLLVIFTKSIHQFFGLSLIFDFKKSVLWRILQREKRNEESSFVVGKFHDKVLIRDHMTLFINY